MSFFGRRFRTKAETERLARELVENAKRDMERMPEENKRLGVAPTAPLNEETTRSRMVCMRCNCPWWDCPHGTWMEDGYVLVVGEPKEPCMLFKGGKS